MKFWLLQLAMVCLLGSSAIAQDPMKVAPNAYQLEFENAYVRVQRVHYAPHVKLPEHDHTAFGTAYVYLNDAGPVAFKHIGLSYGTVTRPAVKAGSFRLYKGVKETHAVENLSDMPSDFLRVEFKTEPAKNSNTLRGRFFRIDAPAGENFQQVQFENEQVRITRLLCAVGKTCDVAMRTTEPSLLVALTPAHLKPPQGKAIKLKLGETRWVRAGQIVQWKNQGQAVAEWLRFDFITAPMKNIEAEKPHAHPHASDPANEKRKAEASEQLKRGADLERAGQVSEAIAAHEQSLALNPELVQAHINLISLYGRTRQFARAEQHYRAAFQINPDLPDIYYNYGVLLAGQERWREAAQTFQQALQLNPYYAEAHYNYGVLIEQEGKLDEAATHYRKAIENKSDYAAAHFHLGRILVNQDKLAEAIKHLQQSLTPEDNETPRFMYALGATYIRAGDKPKGIHYLREALKRAAALHQTQLVISLERDLKLLAQ
jgi:tetratricopeptide (TPR) repeat protein